MQTEEVQDHERTSSEQKRMPKHRYHGSSEGLYPAKIVMPDPKINIIYCSVKEKYPVIPSNLPNRLLPHDHRYIIEIRLP